MRINKDVIYQAQQKAAEVLAQRSLFLQFDKNEDNALDKKEFMALAKNLGLDGEKLFEKFAPINGKISFTQFNKGFADISKEIFKKANKNGDGVLNWKEVEGLSAEFGLDSKKVMKVLDMRGKGAVSQDDFLRNFNKILGNPEQFALTKNQAKAAASKHPANPRTQAALIRQQANAELPSVLDSIGSDKKGGLDFYW